MFEFAITADEEAVDVDSKLMGGMIISYPLIISDPGIGMLPSLVIYALPWNIELGPTGMVPCLTMYEAA